MTARPAFVRALLIATIVLAIYVAPYALGIAP
jgi:hypothetical protein